MTLSIKSEIKDQIKETQASFYYGYIIVLACFFLQILMFGPRGSFGVFINPLTSEFNWSRALISGAFSLSSVITGMSSILMGGLNDRLGPRKVLTLCGILVGSGLILMSLVNSAWQLYFFYVVFIGVGMGGLYAPQMSTVARWFVKRRNIMTGILMSGGGLGGLIGPPLITWLIYNCGWRDAFLFVGIVVFLLIILAAQFLKRDPSEIGRTPYGETDINNTTIQFSIAGFSLKNVLRTRQYWMFAIAIFCFGFSHSTLLVHIVPHSIDHGISATAAAFILSTMSGAMTLGSIAIGLIADRIGSRKAFITCFFLLSAVGLFLLPATSALFFGLVALVMAFGSGGIAVIESSMAASLFGMNAHGAILGSIVFAFTLGGSLGPFLAGLIFDITGNYQLAFLFCTVLIVIAILMVISLLRLSVQADQHKT
ncbi:MAG: MFS transporter [Deltaproteobacteria bacterium]|nr:MFS transporter [Deltaproteobacteria bacterium]